MQFDAPDYSKEGIDNFNDFITDNGIYQKFCEGKFPLFVALENDRIVGIIALRNDNHISLLFVEAESHRKGIGEKLIAYAKEYVITELCMQSLSVFAAPYAVNFYKKCGFAPIDEEKTRDGIRFTPMEWKQKR